LEAEAGGFYRTSFPQMTNWFPEVSVPAVSSIPRAPVELLFAISFATDTSMRTLSARLLYMVGQYEVQ
jgi:multiple sugar transport system permease protein